MQNTRDEVLTRLTALQKMDLAGLRTLWLDMYKKESGKYLSRQCLIDRLSYRIQELAYGGNSAETEARLADHARRYFKDGKYKDDGLKSIKTGDVLTGTYKGLEHHAVVLEDGKFEYNGCIYKSKSAIAKLINGGPCSGNAFFGLKQRSKMVTS